MKSKNFKIIIVLCCLIGLGVATTIFFLVTDKEYKDITVEKDFDKDKENQSDLPLNSEFIVDDEKTSTIELEGQKETITTRTYHSNLNYKMDFDVNAFMPTRENGIDKFSAILNKDIYVEISEIKKEEFDSNESTDMLIYKTDNTSYIKIKITSPTSSDYQEGFLTRIRSMLSTLEFEYIFK
ncbi:MAG: hypothetical protein ACK5HL_02445 [Bacilli bacterium]